MRLSWRGANYLFFVCTALQFTADGHVDAFTPLLLQELGLPPTSLAAWIGILVASTTLTALPLAPFWGVLAERFSRRSMLLRSYYVYAAAMLMMAWAPDVWLLIPARALMGMGYGTIGVIVATQSLLVPPRHFGPAMALVQVGQPIAVSLGPPLGALVIPWIGVRGLFVVDAGAMLLAALAITLLMPEPAAGPVRRASVLGRTGEVLREAWQLKPVRWNFICAAALRGASTIVDAYLPVRITQLTADPATAIGWILGIYGALTAVATWFVGRVLHRIDEATVYTRAAFAITLLTAGLAVAPSIELLAVLAIPRSIPVAFSNTVLHAHNVTVLPPAERTAILSLSPVPRRFGALIFPLLAAASAVLGPGGPLAVGAVGFAASWLAGIKLGRVTRAHRPSA